MKLLLIFLSGIFLVPYSSFSQANFKSGFVVTIKGDTLKGAIDYGEWNYNPKKINFKANSDNVIKTFTPRQITYFEIKGIDSYQTYKGLMTLDANRDNDGYIDTGRQVVDVFLHVMQRGSRLSLLVYNDEDNVRYFFAENTTKIITQLLEHGGYAETEFANAINPYKIQLTATANKYKVLNDKLQDEIDNASYSDEDIQDIMIKINGNHIVAPAHKKTKGLRFFAGAGINVSSAKYSGDNILSSNVTRSGSVLPKISFGADLFNNPDVGKLVFRFELSVAQAKQNFSTATGNGVTDNYNSTTVGLSPQVIYNIYNNRNFKFYLGAGLTGNYVVYNNINYSSQFAPDAQGDSGYLGSFYLSFPVRIGAVFNKNIEVSVMYFNYDAVNNTVGYPFSIKTQVIQAGVNYLFK